MLGKIIKHEFKATYRGYLLLFVSLLAVTILNRTVEYVPFDNRIWNIMKGLLIAAWVILVAFLFMAASILVVMRFYKTMVKDEGYLTHTLPVKKSQLIIGKYITSLVWMIITAIVMVASVFLMAVSSGFIDDLIEFMNEFADLVSSYPQMVGHGILLLIMVLLSVSAGIFQFYASISLGQMFSGHKLAGSVLFYFIINYAISILSTASMVLIPGFIDDMEVVDGMSSHDMMVAEGKVFDRVMIVMIVWMLVTTLVCYFITNYRLSKKLNLE